MDLWKRDLEERRENFLTLPTINEVFEVSRATLGNVSLSHTARRGCELPEEMCCKSRETEGSY